MEVSVRELEGEGVWRGGVAAMVVGVVAGSIEV